MIFISSFFVQESMGQFVVAQDTIKGEIYFCPRLGDFTNVTMIPNDSVFYMFPPDVDIEPWRYVDYYYPSRATQSGYIQGTHLMRIDDYDVVDVERLSSHGSVWFKNEDVRVSVSVSAIPPKDIAIKQNTDGGYTVHGKAALGVSKQSSPKLKYSSISVSIKGKNIVFPRRVYEHLLAPEIENMGVYYNPKKGVVYINANNGGVEAYYSVLWVVSTKGVKNVYVFDPSKK